MRHIDLNSFEVNLLWPSFCFCQATGGNMRNTQNALNIWDYPNSSIGIKESLVSLQVKDFNLLAIRDFKTESLVTAYLTDSKMIFGSLAGLGPRVARMYTLVSQNRKVYFREPLSSTSKVFLNFESYKWSEHILSILQEFIGQETRQFIFNRILYSVDSSLGLYLSLCQNIELQQTASSTISIKNRLECQSALARLILNHPQFENLFVFYFFELISISIGQKKHTYSGTFISSDEAILLLDFLFSKKLFTLNDGKINLSFERITTTLIDYIAGQDHHEAPVETVAVFSELHLSNIKNAISKKSIQFERTTFQAPFCHL